MRGKGEGSVSRSPDGAGWIARIELPAVNGKRQRKKRRAKTRAEALRLLRELQHEIETHGSVSDDRQLVSDAVDRYLSLRRKDSVSAGALEDIEWASAIVVAELGGVKLSKLTVADCDRFLERCADGRSGGRTLSRGRLARLRRCLVRVLDNEMRTGRLVRNVADLSVIPAAQPKASTRRALKPAELTALLEAASDGRLIIIDLCGRNGLRPAEARALRWEDVDLDAQELRVAGQMDKQGERTDVKRAHNAARTIRLDRATIDRLKAWREEQDDLAHKAGPAWQPSGLVATTAFGTAIDRHSLARTLRLLCDKLGIDPAVSPYELRHTAISHQADAGCSSWEIADWAGTSEAMISRVYRHRLHRVAAITPAHSQDL